MKISIKPGKILRKLWAQFSAPAAFCLLIFLLATVVDFLIWNISARNLRDILTEISYAFLFGLPIATALCVLLPRTKTAILLSWIGGLAAAAIEYFLPNSNLYTGIALACVCICLWKAAGRENPALRLNQIGGWFFVCLGLSIVLMIALTIIQSAIMSLLFPNVSDGLRNGVSSMVIYLSFFLFAPWMFLGGLQDETTPDDKRLGFQKFNTRFLLPLSLLLMAVLLSYVAKIVITWSMPVGTMNGYALAALALFTFFHLTLTGEESKFAAFFHKWVAWLMLPILTAQQVGVWIRVSAYGLTESRIYGIVLTALCSAVVITSILRKRANWFFPAAAIAIIVFVASPLNAANMARVNQESRLKAALERNNMLTVEGSIISNPDADMADRTIIYESIDYLLNQDAPDNSLTAWLNDYFSEQDLSYIFATSDDLFKLLGFSKPQTQTTGHYMHWTFNGSAQMDELDARGIAYAKQLTISRQYKDMAEYRMDTADTPQPPTSYFIVDTDALNKAMKSNTTIADIPLTLVINGEEILLNPWLADTNTSLQIQDGYRSVTLEDDCIPLTTGQIFHINQFNLSSFSDSTLYLEISGWLLTPESE